MLLFCSAPACGFRSRSDSAKDIIKVDAAAIAPAMGLASDDRPVSSAESQVPSLLCGRRPFLPCCYTDHKADAVRFGGGALWDDLEEELFAQESPIASQRKLQLQPQPTGYTPSRLLGRLLGPQEASLLMAGLDGAGKTTALYRLELEDAVATVPTVAFNVETIDHGRHRLTIWDLGGQQKIRRLWRHYCTAAQGVVWVVDSCDRGRMEEAREELHTLLRSEDLHDACLLVYANKQDSPLALPVAEVTEALGLYGLTHARWFVQGSCATRGDGLREGLDWLASALQRRP